jgi:hypothetical protein
MMKRLACLLALLAAAPLFAADPILLQPQTGDRGLQMEVSDGRATLRRPNGQRLRLPVYRGEHIEELVEFDNGWAAAGVRVLRHRRELVVVQDAAAGIERLASVPKQLGNYRVRPVPLASQAGLEGVAWLEGDSPTEYAVRVAAWTGAGWDLPETVSSPRRGGQAGLTGVVLEDGRWLLVWSASEGRGSEIFWSMRVNGRWTPSRRLAAANRVPDVTPSLIPLPDGALLVWAQRQAAGYGLQVARFRDTWSAPRTLAAAGAWSPRFAALGEDGRFLLHRTADGWTALEVDGSGRVRRRAKFDTERHDRPVLTRSAGSLALRWQRATASPQLRWEGEF